MAGLVEECNHLFLKGLTDIQYQLGVLGDVIYCKADRERILSHSAGHSLHTKTPFPGRGWEYSRC